MAERVLSVFFDESGDQGLADAHSPFYILAMVFHDQSRDISGHIRKFDDHLRMVGQDAHPIHTGPVIRKEPPYEDMLMQNRKGLFDSLFNFMRKTDVRCGAIWFDKTIACSETVSVAAVLERKLDAFLLEHGGMFQDFDRVIGYYDNGQKYLSDIIGRALGSLPLAVELRRSSPADYKLGQVADLACTMELLGIKASRSALGRSELDFFGGSRKLKKDYLKQFKRQAI